MSDVDRYGVFGHPVGHSLSPFIHGMFARQTGQHMVYRPHDVRPEELAERVREFFAGGTKLFWIVDPAACTVEVFTGPEQSTVLSETDVLDGGEVLPGFKLLIRDWFARAGKRE